MSGDDEVVGETNQVDLDPTAFPTFGEPFLEELFQAVQGHVRQHWGGYAPNNVAKRVLDFSTTVSRERLRPQYGDGFAGAPLEQDRGVKPDEERRQAQENTEDQSQI